MRAIVYDQYGPVDVLEEREVPDARAPRRGEVQVRVRAAALNPKDNFVREGRFRALTGRTFPRPFGHDFAGEVTSVGRGVTGLAVGDRVWGCFNDPRAMRGTFAQRIVISASALSRAPATLDVESCAAVPLAAQTALQALRDVARVVPGDRVLLHGASGGVGVFAIQIAKRLGAHVTTTSGARNLEFCRSLGADDALDYATDEPFGRGRAFRVVMDIYGNRSLDKARGVLAGNGAIYVTTVPSLRILRDTARTLVGSRRARLVIIRPRRADLELLARWTDAGELRPVIDRVYDWADVRDAAGHLAGKHARGKVVVRVP